MTTDSAAEAIARDLWDAIARSDQNAILDCSDRLAIADRLVPGIRAVDAAMIQSSIGNWLADRNAADVDAILCYARAMRLLASDPEADPELTHDVFEAIIDAAQKRGDTDIEIEMLRQGAATSRNGDGLLALRHISYLTRLHSRLSELANDADADQARLLKSEIALLKQQIADVNLQRDQALKQRRGLAAESLRKVQTEVALPRAATHEICEVLFCTSREHHSGPDKYQAFGGSPLTGEPNFEGYYGVAEVLVPLDRQIGQSQLSERGYEKRYIPWMGAGRHRYIFDDYQILDRSSFDQFALELGRSRRERIDVATKTEAILFVHGFATRFDEAMLRAAQLGSDLNISGPIAAYSWPSAGNERKYTQDVLQIINSHCTHLLKFIERVAETTAAIAEARSEPFEITLVAHSLGSKFLCEALQLFQPSRLSAKIARVIFASPAELTATALADCVSKCRGFVGRFCVYTSHLDGALSWRYLGGWAADRPMVGADRVTLSHELARRKLLDVVDIVETSGISNSDNKLIGHSDYATSALHDLRMQLWFAPLALQRGVHLARIDDAESAHYWQFLNLDDGRPRASRTDPWYLSERGATHAAIAAVRSNGSISAALTHHKRALEAALLNKNTGEVTYHQKLLRLLEAIEAAVNISSPVN